MLNRSGCRLAVRWFDVINARCRRCQVITTLVIFSGPFVPRLKVLKYMKASKQLTLVTEVPHLIPGVKEGWQWHNGHLRMMSLLPSHQHCCYPHHPLLPCIFCHCRGRFYSAIHPALGDYSKAQLIRFWLSSCSVKCNVQQQYIWTTYVLIILCNKRLVQVWTSYLVL